MRSLVRVLGILPLLGLTAFASAAALGVEIPKAGGIPNWPAPAIWSPAKAHQGLSALDVTNPMPFIGLAPCRLVDTRGTAGVPINTGGAFSANEARTWVFTGLCGIPAGASAVSLNITVTNTGGQTAFGFVKVWPGGGTEPNVSTLNWSSGGVTESNAAVVPFGTSPAGSISLRSGNNSSDVIVDVNGYYAVTPAAPGGSFKVSNAGTYAIEGQTSDAAFASTGVLGFVSSTTGITYGVLGLGISQTAGAVGVRGLQEGTSSVTFGVQGAIFSTVQGAAGVYGVDGTGDPGHFLVQSIGVRGASAGGAGVWGDGFNGVIGNGVARGVQGNHLSTNGTNLWYGVLGEDTGTYGVFAAGNVGASGTKFFVEPHPTDPSKVIRYASLEGPESGTYFRGTAKTVGGEATIEVPESFRIVTDEEGLTVQLTPVGALATLAVVSQDLDRIVVHSSKDVTFHYLAQGVRRAFKSEPVIVESSEFRPESPTERMPQYLTEEARRRLIANGTYNADGSVNMETAERLGWAANWKRTREQAAKPSQPSPGSN